MPEPLRRIEGVAAPLPTPNIDTDVIMPKRFLRTITREGLAEGVCADQRFRPDGSPDPAFILNRAPWDHACILVVGDNFGCGSSREHAVWGLAQLGIRAFIGTSFAGIFSDNCRRNGLAAITIDPAPRDRLLHRCAVAETSALAIDLVDQVIRDAEADTPFILPEAIRADLLAGRDAIAATLEHAEDIRRFETTYLAR